MRKVAYFVSAAILAGCGGGGSDSSQSSSLNVTTSTVSNPTLTLSTDKTFVRTGETLTVTWNSTNANSCLASGSWSGNKAKSGSETFEVKSAGINQYTLECTGSNSTVKQTSNVTVPHPVFATSYENKNNISFHQTQVPTVKSLGIKLDADEQDSNERSVTFADFFQEGKVSAFVTVTRHKNLYGVSNLSDSPSKAYFLSQNSQGVWVDRTSELIKSNDDRYNCVTVSYAITADFNNDKVPDIFLSCNGIDYDLGNGLMSSSHPNFRQTYLEYPVVYVSQADKTYKKIKLPFQLYAHQAAAGDINGDGAVDVVITNQISETERLPFILMGNGDGTFYKNTSLLPNQLLNQNKNGLYQVQLIPIDGRLDIMFGYSDESLWFKGNRNGGFDIASVVKIKMPVSKVTNVEYSMPLDVVYINESFYFSTNTSHKDGTEWAIVKTNTKSLTHEVIPTFNNLTSNFQSYSAQIKPDDKGFLVAYTGGCMKAPRTGMCSMQVKY